MYGIKFVKNGEVVERNFEDYLDLIEFVATERVPDEALEEVTLGEKVIGDGINGLASYALNMVAETRAAREEFKEEFDEYSEDFEEIDESEYECERPDFL